MSKLRIERSIFDALRVHSEEDYPHESCGVLVGTLNSETWTIFQAIRATNARRDSPQNLYAIEPKELVKTVREARIRGLEIAGFYHSHPDHPATWSQTDLTEAHWLGCCYVITQVHQGRAATTNSFLLAGTHEENKHFIPQSIEFLD